MASKPSFNVEPVIEEHSKLILIEQNLIAVLQKIDNELNQTDVEWMYLKSLVESRKEAGKNVIETPTQHVSTEPTVKDEHRNIDDQTVNATQLDLSLGMSQKHTASDEEDSD